MMTLEEAEKRTEEARAYLHIDEKIAELANLDSRIANPDFWNDTDNAQQLGAELFGGHRRHGPLQPASECRLQRAGNR